MHSETSRQDDVTCSFWKAVFWVEILDKKQNLRGGLRGMCPLLKQLKYQMTHRGWGHRIIRSETRREVMIAPTRKMDKNWQRVWVWVCFSKYISADQPNFALLSSVFTVFNVASTESMILSKRHRQTQFYQMRENFLGLGTSTLRWQINGHFKCILQNNSAGDPWTSSEGAGVRGVYMFGASDQYSWDIVLPAGLQSSTVVNAEADGESIGKHWVHILSDNKAVRSQSGSKLKQL